MTPKKPVLVAYAIVTTLGLLSPAWILRDTHPIPAAVSLVLAVLNLTLMMHVFPTSTRGTR